MNDNAPRFFDERGRTIQDIDIDTTYNQGKHNSSRINKGFEALS